jgi:ATP-dependent RNA helicase DeaD
MDTPPFSSLGLSPLLLEAVESLGFEQPSPIQALAIPVALKGSDVVGLSETGSGKTAAFGLPALQMLDVNSRHPQVLIVCPTRELAVQVCEQVHILGAGFGRDLIVAPVYGGAPIDRQMKMLHRGAQIVVGTPGRLLDLHRRRALRLDGVKMAVLDEADRMLDMGFRDEMEEMLAALPEERQMLFFSATMNRNVEGLIRRFGNDPKVLQVERKAMTVESVEQSCYEVRHRSKVEVLSRLLDMDPPRLAIVFCNTKRVVDDCTEMLIARGYAADRLHGDITQAMRERVLKRFRDGSVELLVATDVAARGLDIDNVDAVFNYDLPQDPEDYVHRIGRTGRAGRSGRAISFVFGRDIYRLQTIERYTRHKIRRERIPTQEQVEGKLADQLFESVRERLESGEFRGHEAQVDRLLEAGHTATDIAGAVLSLLQDSIGREGEEIAEDKGPPPRRPRDGQRQDRGDRGERRERRERRGERGERNERSGREEPRNDDRGRDSHNDRGRGDREPSRRENRGDDRHDHGDRSGPRDEGDGDTTTLFLNIGQNAGLKPGDIAGMLYREADLPKGTVGRIRMMPHQSLVDVRSDLVEKVFQRCEKSTLRGRPFNIDLNRKG